MVPADKNFGREPQRTLTGWCTRCGGSCFDEVRHECRKPSKDAQAMIIVQQENQRLRAMLASAKVSLQAIATDDDVNVEAKVCAKDALRRLNQ